MALNPHLDNREYGIESGIAARSKTVGTIGTPTPRDPKADRDECTCGVTVEFDAVNGKLVAFELANKHSLRFSVRHVCAGE